MTPRRHLAAVPAQGNRAVLYVRVSSVAGREAEEFHSPAMQAKAMRDLLARRGLVEVELVEDIDVSGRTFARVGIRRVLELARNRQIDVVALYDLSRLGRNTAESLRTIGELRELGVSVASTVEQIDDTPEGQFQLGIWLGLAQLQSDQKSRQWRQVIEHRLEQGLFHGSVPPRGYRRDGRSIVPDPVLAPAVREVFRRYAAGERIYHIVRWWHGATGRKTQIVVLKRMLANPVYVGRVRVNGREVPGRHESLVSDALWRKVQHRLAADSQVPSRRLAVANSLAGLAFCDECSRPLQMHFDKRRREGGAATLVCVGKREIGDCCGPGTPLIAEVEAEILAEIDRECARLTVNLDAAREAKRARQVTAKVDAGRLRRELAEVGQALGRLGADRARRVITVEEHQAAAELLRAEQGRLRDALAQVEQVRAAPSPESVVKLARALRARWDRMTAEEKNRALRPLVQRVRVSRASYYRQPVAERCEVILF